MMKILVFADSHGDADTMASAVGEENPDMVFYLGDGMADAERLSAVYPGLEVHSVNGNVDEGFREAEDTKHLDVCGRKIILTHGHLFGLTKGMEHEDKLLAYAKAHSAEMVLFGHTHRPYAAYRQGVWLINPGRAGKRSYKKIYTTCCVLNLSVDSFAFTINEI